jgi:hypothetical protein
MYLLFCPDSQVSPVRVHILFLSVHVSPAHIVVGLGLAAATSYNRDDHDAFGKALVQW